MIKLFKGILVDISILFRHFLNFNFSKIVIYIYSILLGLLLSLPFVLIYGLIGEVAFLDIYTNLFNGISINTFNAFQVDFIYIYMSLGYMVGIIASLDFLNFIYLFGGIVFVIGYFYSYILLININNAYINGKQIKINANYYFDYRRIMTFFTLSFMNIFILLLSLVVFALLTGILLLFSGDLSQLNELVLSRSNNYFSIISLINLIIATFVFIYLFYRIIFSYFIFSDEEYYKKGKSALFYIKKSYSKTKSIKKFLKFIFIIVSFFVVIFLPMTVISELLIKNSNGLNIYMFFFSVFNFILIYGIFTMIYTSFYNRKIK